MSKTTKTSRRQFLRTAAGIAVTLPCCRSRSLAEIRCVLAAALAADTNPSPQREGAIEFESSDQKLVAGFRWAKAQAMTYARSDGSIGPWYEAALPGRNAFCMRDVSHMSTGAQFLGLGPRTLNMLRRFAANISASKKWCTWWEITNDNQPAPVDYSSDHDFWYDLPASFDVVDACYRQWLWSRDDAYLAEVFLNFYRHTVTDYVAAWSRRHDGLLEHLSADGHMGIATYDEDLKDQVLVASDLIAAQYAAYRDYACMERAKNDENTAAGFERKADDLKALYNSKWWDAARNCYYGALGEDGKFHPDLQEGDGRCTVELPLYYGLTDSGAKTDAALDLLEDRLKTDLNRTSAVIGGVEGRSYMPDIFYAYGRARAGYAALTALMDPSLKRREYPEVSYTVIGNLCSGLMGIRPLPGVNAIETFPQLTDETNWAMVHHSPVGLNVIAVRHTSPKASAEPAASILTNEAGPEIVWQAAFPVRSSVLSVNGKKFPAQANLRTGGREESHCQVHVRPGETCTVSVQPASLATHAGLIRTARSVSAETAPGR